MERDKNVKKLKRPKVIASTHQKGGVGKTTNCIILSVGLSIMGYKVLAVDSDPMANLWRWATSYPDIKSTKSIVESDDKFALIYNGQYREQPYSLRIELLDSDSSLMTLSKKKHEYDIVVIDCSSGIPLRTTIAMDLADLIIIPVRPGADDVDATKEIVDLIKLRQSNNPDRPKATFLVTQAVKNLILSKDIDLVLQEHGFPVLKSRTHMRPAAYQGTHAIGQTIFSSEKYKDAEIEMKNLIDEIESLYIKED